MSTIRRITVTITAVVAAAVISAPGASAKPERIGDPSPKQVIGVTTATENAERPCFIFRADWNEAEGPQPTCPDGRFRS